MKTKYLFYLLFGLLVTACSEDKGNYNYTPINELTISGIKSQTYICPFGSKLEIPVTLSRNLSQTESNLSYRWEIDGKEVSTEKNLSTEIPAGISYGDKVCRYTVTDKTNGMSWSQKFKVSIVSEFSWGYYFLTEKEDHSTVISFLPISDSTEVKTCLHTTSIDGFILGKYPKVISATYGSISALNTYGWNMQIITGDEEFPVVTTNNTVFNLTGTISSKTFIDQSGNPSFKPDGVMIEPRGTPYFTSEGKVIAYTEQLLYRPAKHDKEYHWSHPVQNPQQPSSGFFFDDISKKYYVLTPRDDANYDANALDAVSEFTNNHYFGDEIIIGNGAYYTVAADYSSMSSTLTIVSTANGNVYLTDYNYSMLYVPPYPETKECAEPVVLPLSGVNKDSKALLVKDNWYITAGNSMYTSPRLLPKLSPFMDISELEYGKIVNVGVSAQESRLVVTTYNENSPEEMKGSIILIDLQTKTKYPHKNVIHHCVSILGANANSPTYPFPAGDGK